MEKDLKEAILEVARHYGAVSIESGIVKVRIRDGEEIWDFTVPMRIG